ncbi:MAG: head GIN domain-containing protein [Flavobacterium haoranii]
MIKLIIQLTKIIVATLIALFMNSCVNFNSISGDGNVTTSKRKVTNFTAVDANTGLEVVIKQGNNFFVEVEADSNLQDHIKTEVENNTLKVYCDQNIYKSSARKVYIEMPVVQAISTSSGASLESQNTIVSDILKLDSSSGSEMKLTIKSQKLTCDSSSGSEINVSGEAIDVTTSSSSGSSINLSKLVAENVSSDSSSGSSTTVNAKNKLKANASSGSSIDYLSSPKEVTLDENSGGSISKQ